MYAISFNQGSAGRDLHLSGRSFIPARGFGIDREIFQGPIVEIMSEHENLAFQN